MPPSSLPPGSLPPLPRRLAPLPAGFFTRDVVAVARDLVGAVLLVDGVGGTVAETEAYGRDDPASHSFAGPTARNRAMFGPPGHAYVYRSYGLHWCFNVVCHEGCAVLIRALLPQAGLARMAERRGLADPRRLCAGPGRLCQALAVGPAFDGAPLAGGPISLRAADPPGEPVAVAAGPRIGITKAAERPWRFGLAGSAFLSRPFPR